MNRDDDAVISTSQSNAEVGDIQSTLSRRRVLQGGLGAVALAFLGNPPETLAQGEGSFFGMITNFGNAPRVNAHLDISVDTRTAPGPVDILYNVFDANGGQLAEFSVTTNANGFASSAMAPPPNRNLFRLTNGEPGLIQARTPASATTTTGVLYQRGAGSRLVVGVPPAWNGDGIPRNAGKIFPITLGDVTSACLLVANVSGGDIAVDVFVGSVGGPGGGSHTTPRLGNKAMWRVDLTPDDENAHLIVSATDVVVVQLMLDDGRVNGVTCIPV